MSTRLIYVDDTSPLLSYRGPWAGGDTYSVNTVLGGPFNNTLHALSGSGSFTFFFTGTSVSVLGSSQASSQPSWDCWLDGNKLISNSISLNLNNVELCSLPDISPNVAPSHNLTVVASGTTNTPFLFDRIEYILDASVILDNATVVVDRSDPHIGYSGWSTSPIGIGIMATSVPGSYLVFDFVGIQITWITTLAYNVNTTVAASAQYTIDNETSFPFQVAVHSSTVQLYNLVSFQTAILSPGPHTLSVEYGVDNLNGSAPLVLDHFIIRNSTTPPFTLSPPDTTSTQSRAGLSKGTIAGVVIGSVVGLALIIFILVWTIRFVKGPKKATEPVPYAAREDGQDL